MSSIYNRNKILIYISFLLLFYCNCTDTVSADSGPIFTGKETYINIKPTDTNYYFATLVEESESYNPTFYNDYLLTVGGKPVLHFTRIQDEIADLYYYIKHPQDLQFIFGLFKKNRKQIDEISERIIPSLKKYVSLVPKYEEEGIFSRVSEKIYSVTQVSVDLLIDNISSEKLDRALYQYLRSNGIKSLNQINADSEILDMIVNKFYMLSTTCFFREWVFIKPFTDYLDPLKAQARKAKRPLKLKVYACSTGMEPISYAIELLEAGITEFTILASDINKASLSFARNMKYSYSAYEILSTKAKEKFKKYFQLDKKLNIWALKDPEFFKSRIKYVAHNILDPLPYELEKNFAPPYDLISMLNVLLYLDKKAVNKRKFYWTEILNNNGILILHDRESSLLDGSFNYKWSMNRYYIVNPWINIKTDMYFTIAEKMENYKDRYYNNTSLNNIILLNNIYMLMGLHEESIKLCKAYLEKYPYSEYALSFLAAYYSRERKKEDLREIIEKVKLTCMPIDEVMSIFLKYETSKDEKMFLEHLKQSYKQFMGSFKQMPGEAEKIFDFRSPSSKKWDKLRLILKAYSYLQLQKYYIFSRNTDIVERITMQSVSIIERLIKDDPRHTAAIKVFSMIFNEYVMFCMEEGLYENIITLSRRAIIAFEEGPLDKDYIYYNFLLGNIYAYRVAVMEKTETVESNIMVNFNKSLNYYKKVFPYIDDIGFSRLRLMYHNLGNNYLIRGRHYLKAGKKKLAESDFTKSFEYFEKGIELNPIYAKDIMRARKKLFKIIEENELQLKF